MHRSSTRPASWRLTLLLGFLLPAVVVGPAEAQARRPASSTTPRQASPAAVADTTARARSAAPRVLHSSPSGDTLGSLAPGARLEVLGQEGEWARVRVEGWVRITPGTELNAPGPLRGLTLRELRAEPDRYRGQSVQLQVQFVAVERADSLRTDLRPGEVYILARDPGGERGFIYVVVPPELRAAAGQLVPLQRLNILGRVRTGRSPLMGHPILDLVELRP